MDVNTGATTDGARLLRWTCHVAINQQWRITLAGRAAIVAVAADGPVGTGSDERSRSRLLSPRQPMATSGWPADSRRPALRDRNVTRVTCRGNARSYTGPDVMPRRAIRRGHDATAGDSPEQFGDSGDPDGAAGGGDVHPYHRGLAGPAPRFGQAVRLQR
ncbi:hypothetical protein [Micromonospora rubida]